MPYSLALGLPLLRTPPLGEIGTLVPAAPLPPEFGDPDYAAVIDVDTGGAGDYVSLFAAEAAERRLNNALPVAFITRASTALDDSVVVTFSNANWGTTRVELWQATSDYHNGIFFTTKYFRSEPLNSTLVNLLIDGLQLRNINVLASTLDIKGSGIDVTLRNMIVKNITAPHTLYALDATSGLIKVYNCSAIGGNHPSHEGFYSNLCPIEYDHCTARNCARGFNSVSAVVPAIVKNCVGDRSTSQNFSGTFHSSSNYNISSDGVAPGWPTLNSLVNENINLKNVSNDDLRLVLDSPGFKDGTPSGLSWNYGFDITRTAWPSTPSMGINQGVSVDRSRLFTSANSEYLSITDNAALSGANDQALTFAAMVNLLTVTSSKGIAWKGSVASSASDYEWLLFYLNGTNRFRFLVSNGTDARSINADSFGIPVLNTWYFLVCSYNPQTDMLSIQINNGIVDSAVFGFTPKATWDSTKPFEIGRSVGSTIFMGGRICRVGFWKRVLTAEERTWLFNSNVGRIRNELGIAGNDGADLLTNLQGYWNLDEFDRAANDSFSTNKLTDNNTVTSGDGPA